MTTAERTAVVLLSGGQDSTTCLFWALRGGYTHVLCLTVGYGQRHDREIQSAADVVERARLAYPDARIDHETVEVGVVLTGTSPLVSGGEVGRYESAADLPGGIEPTFVPGRNALFLVVAANRAVAIDGDIITGVCQEDYGGYPDCRRSFIDAMEVALALAMYDDDRAVAFRAEEGEAPVHGQIRIRTPLMDLTKAESVELAADLPGCLDALGVSHTCYNGEFPPCGECHACHLRAKGFQEAGVQDPLTVRA